MNLLKQNISDSLKKVQLEALEKYVLMFDKVVFFNNRLGTRNNTGLAQDMQSNIMNIKSLFVELNTLASRFKSSQMEGYIKLLIVIVFSLIIFAFFLSFYISKRMTWKLSALSNGMERFIQSGFQEVEDGLPMTDNAGEVGSILFYYKILQHEIRDLIVDFKKRVAERTNEVEKQKEQIVNQSKKIQIQRDELYTQNKYIEEQRLQLEIKNGEMLDSIKYAASIQHSLMPSKKQIEAIFPDHFIVNIPLDIVSGDFYWVNSICVGEKYYKIFAVADCTGHGVPGALVSMLGISFLNELVIRKKILDASLILDSLRQNMLDSMIRFVNQDKPSDGMDISIAVIDVESDELSFSGANRDLYLIRENELEVCKGDKMPIGKHISTKCEFAEKKIKLQDNDCLYMFTDGYTDQFGGADNKKFTKHRLRGYLLEINRLEMFKQADNLTGNFKTWKGLNEQVDDILVFGVRYHANDTILSIKEKKENTKKEEQSVKPIFQNN